MFHELIPVIIFYFIYRMIKELLDYFLKKKIINSGHLEKAEILGNTSPTFAENSEVQKYPALKWGLVLLFAGIGLLSVGFLYFQFEEMGMPHKAREIITGGIFLISISLGFLIYFLIVMKQKK